MKKSMKIIKYLLELAAVFALGLSTENAWCTSNIRKRSHQQVYFEPSVECNNTGKIKEIIIYINPNKQYILRFNKKWQVTEGYYNKKAPFAPWETIKSTEVLYNFFVNTIMKNSLILKIINYMIDIQNEITRDSSGNISATNNKKESRFTESIANHIFNSGHLCHLPYGITCPRNAKAILNTQRSMFFTDNCAKNEYKNYINKLQNFLIKSPYEACDIKNEEKELRKKLKSYASDKIIKPIRNNIPHINKEPQYNYDHESINVILEFEYPIGTHYLPGKTENSKRTKETLMAIALEKTISNDGSEESILRIRTIYPNVE